MQKLVALASVATAWLAVPAGAAAAPFQYDCQATLGKDPELWIERTGPDYRVRGTLTSADLVEWPYPPGPVRMVGNDIPPTTRGAHITIMSAVAGNHVSLGIFAEPGVEDRLVIRAGFTRDTVHEARTVTTISIGELGRISVPFDMIADAQGVTVEVAGQHMRFDVPIGARGEIRVSCAGGDFMFRGLDWDR